MGEINAALGHHISEVAIAEFVVMYQRTQRIITDESKWRPLNSLSESNEFSGMRLIMHLSHRLHHNLFKKVLVRCQCILFSSAPEKSAKNDLSRLTLELLQRCVYYHLPGAGWNLSFAPVASGHFN
jgi:hypothetical protein